MGRGFFRWLEDSIERNDSLLCVGLDPRPERLGGEDAFAFNRRIIDATADLVCAYKPNFAFYEALGLPGLEALQRTIEYIHQCELPVILDAKRGDIGSTAEAYAHAAFQIWAADAVTVNPYLGSDCVAPFAQHEDKGVFVLCHTSNPGAQELQSLEVDRQPLYRRVAELVQRWNAHGNLGLVVGATYPQVLAEMRRTFPHLWFLVPGVGAQGGDLEATVRAGLDAHGRGLIINVARSVIFADDPRQAARALRDRINTIRQSPISNTQYLIPNIHYIHSLVLALHELGAVQFGDFRLKSGKRSPIYIDLRLLVSDPKLMRQVAQAYVQLMAGLEFDRIAAIPYGGLPIGQAVALEVGKPLLYPRKEIKEHGTGRVIEGRYQAGETVVVLDDLITTGSSKFEAIAPLEAAGLRVRDVVVLIDRQQGGAEELAARGYRLHSVLTMRELLDVLERHGRISAAQRVEVERFLVQGG